MPLPSHALQPGVQPLENQKHDWPALHTSVPLVHEQLYGSMVPVAGKWPPLHGGSSASTELRAHGIIIEPCASTPLRPNKPAAAEVAASRRAI